MGFGLDEDNSDYFVEQDKKRDRFARERLTDFEQMLDWLGMTVYEFRQESENEQQNHRAMWRAIGRREYRGKK